MMTAGYPGLCSAGFLQSVADVDVIMLQGWLHFQHFISQVHDGSGGVLVVLLRYVANA